MDWIYKFPASSRLDRFIPKSKIYEHVQLSPKLKRGFTEKLERITWSHKLSPDTVNLPSGKSILEFQVFELKLKTGEIDKDLIAVIDRAIPSPIVFVLSYGDYLCYGASYKRDNEANRKKVVLSRFFNTQWIPSDSKQKALPVSLNLGSLYNSIFKNITGISSRESEKIDDFINRSEDILAKERELAKLESRLKREKQFNRKVEINREVRAVKKEIESLR